MNDRPKPMTPEDREKRDAEWDERKQEFDAQYARVKKRMEEIK